VKREFIVADGRAEEELLEETVSYRKDVTMRIFAGEVGGQN
jgi:hypothetical protein